jgi:hypothetical protein
MRHEHAPEDLRMADSEPFTGDLQTALLDIVKAIEERVHLLQTFI